MSAPEITDVPTTSPGPKATKVLSDDAVFVDRLLNRGSTPDEVHLLAAATHRRLPTGYAECRVAERREQKAIKEALPDGITQRTPEWYSARENYVTASDFWTAAFGSDAAKKRFVAGKAGAGKPFLGSAATRHGVKYEDVARLLYEHDMGCAVREYGLLPHKTVEIMAASPDGVSDVGVCVEIKAPVSRTLADVPPEYHAQMQGQMEVAGLRFADFVVCRAAELEPAEFWPAFEAAFEAGYGYERYGAVGTAADGSHVHSTPGASPAELRAWIQAAVPAAVTTHHVFDFRVTRLEHDPAFVADMLRGLEETWAGVVAARANPGLCAAASAVQPSLGFAFKNFSKSFKNG